MTRVFADTNVLFPFSIMDLMLALTEDSIHELMWTETLLAEWERVIVREHHRSTSSARSITKAIRDCFAEGEIREADYAHLIDQMPSGDPDDRQHIAAAVSAQVRTIVTWNLRDFPAAGLRPFGITAIDPDTYLCELLNDLPNETISTVVRLAAEKRRPPRSPCELTDDFARAGAKVFASRVRAMLEAGGAEA